MDIKPFKYFFTGNWAFTPTTIEIKDNSFCKNLFGNPAITINGSANASMPGIQMGNTFFIGTQPIALNAANEMVTINHQQLQIITTRLDLMLSVIEKLKSKLLELNDTGFNFSFIAYNLSIECEVGSIIDNSSKWLSKKFVENNFELIDNFKNSDISVADILFVIQKENSSKITIQIQPRTTKNDYLFFRIIEENNIIIDDKALGPMLNTLQNKFFEQINKFVPNV